MGRAFGPQDHCARRKNNHDRHRPAHHSHTPRRSRTIHAHRSHRRHHRTLLNFTNQHSHCTSFSSTRKLHFPRFSLRNARGYYEISELCRSELYFSIFHSVESKVVHEVLNLATCEWLTSSAPLVERGTSVNLFYRIIY